MSRDEEGPISPNLFPNGPHLVLCGVVEGSMCRRCVVVSRAALGGVARPEFHEGDYAQLKLVCCSVILLNFGQLNIIGLYIASKLLSKQS